MKCPSQRVERETSMKEEGNVVINAFDPTLSLSISGPPRLQPGYTHPHTRCERYSV
jgi:hypothetical protein